MEAATFRQRVEATFRLLELCRATAPELRHRSRDFVLYWVRRGKSPAEIVEIATGRKFSASPDAHLGGIEA